MKTSLPLPCVAHLHTILQYDPATGFLYWNKSSKIAGCATRNGYTYYYRLRIGKHLYMAHRVIWCMHTGTDPGLYEIDHINGNGLDNRLQNLRIVEPSVNRRNLIRKRRNNIPTGVYWSERLGKYEVSAKRNGKQIHLGLFDNVASAKIARLTFDLQTAIEQKDTVSQLKCQTALDRELEVSL